MKIQACEYCGSPLHYFDGHRLPHCFTPNCPNEVYLDEVEDELGFDETPLFDYTGLQQNDVHERHLELVPIHVLGRVTTWSSQ